MLKKLTLLAMSVAALVAFIAPAAAQATGPLITNAEGGAAGKITATSTNTVSETENGTLECTTVTLHLTATENANTTVKGSGTGTASGNPGAEPPTHTGRCASSSGLGVEITSITVSDIHLTKHGGVTTGTAKFSYTYDLYFGALKVAECTFGGEATVERTGASSMSINGNLTKTAGSEACPAAGTISGSFSVKDENGEAAIIH